MRLALLGSGSRGNATVVQCDSCTVMVDCGLGLRDLERRASEIDLDLNDVDALLITHEHSDHGSGAAALARRYGLPVYLTYGTAASGRFDDCPGLNCFNADSVITLGELRIDAVAVPHDAREPVQFVFRSEGRCLGILTDLGMITPHVQQAFGSCDVLVLEFNHDRRRLAEGPYPPALKARVGGNWGHLSNAQAVEFLRRSDCARLAKLVVAHVSEKNNCHEAIRELLAVELPELLPRLRLARQDQVTPWIEVPVLAAVPLATAY